MLLEFIQADWANVFLLIGALGAFAWVVFTIIFPFVYPEERVKWAGILFVILGLVPYGLVWVLRGAAWVVRAIFCDC